MRLPKALTTLAIAFVPVVAASVAFAPVAQAESTRTLRVELTPDALGHFAVENLAGRMRVHSAAVKTVVVVATIHAEDDALAQKMKLEQVVGKGGVATLRVRYPLDDGDVVRYPGLGQDNGFLGKMFGGSNTTADYEGHRVKVASNSGVLLYTDVEVQVPGHLESAVFRNLVGSIDGRDLEGKIKFDASSGDVTLASVSGTIQADTGSGDIKAKDGRGSFSCDTGSGDCELTGFEGEAIRADVGSGDVTLRHATARLVDVDSGSGDLRVLDSNVEEFRADTGSGDVHLESSGSRLNRVAASTGSGDVVLRLSPDATFEATADQGSGDIEMGFKDAQAIVRHKEVVGYRRGDGRIKIDVETGSGDLTIQPGL